MDSTTEIQSVATDALTGGESGVANGPSSCALDKIAATINIADLEDARAKREMRVVQVFNGHQREVPHGHQAAVTAHVAMPRRVLGGSLVRI